MMYKSMKEISEIDSEKFVFWLASTFHVIVPDQVTCVEDSEEVAALLAKCSNNYSYLIELYSYLRILARKAKKEGNKDLQEEFMDKRDIVEKMAQAVKQQYQAASRLITIRHDNLEELHMSDTKTCR